MDENDATAPVDEPFEPGDVADESAIEPERSKAGDQAALSEPAAMLRDLAYYLATNLVDDPDAVELDVQQRGGTVNLQLFLPKADVGRVIGRGGRIAQAMRTALMVAGSRYNLRVNLNIDS